METDFNKLLNDAIKERVEQVVSEMLAPLDVLKKYKDVDVLTLEEAAEVLRDKPEIIREAFKRGELPGVASGRKVVFPKRMLVELLLGIWKKEKKTMQPKPDDRSAKDKKLEEKIRFFAQASKK